MKKRQLKSVNGGFGFSDLKNAASQSFALAKKGMEIIINSEAGQRFLTTLGATASKLGDKAAVSLERKLTGKFDSMAQTVDRSIDKYLG